MQPVSSVLPLQSHLPSTFLLSLSTSSGGKFSVKFLQTYSLFQRVIKVYSVITNYNNWLSAMITLSLGFQKVNLFLYYSSKILRCAPHLSQYVCSFGCFAPHCGQMTAPCVTRISSFNDWISPNVCAIDAKHSCSGTSSSLCAS